MKKIFLVIIVMTMVGGAACKKSYDCRAKDTSGNGTILKCEHCSKKEMNDYKGAITDAGYTSVDCVKE